MTDKHPTTVSQASEEPVDIVPNPSDLWSGIGGHFDTLSQVIAEFVDNSIGNIEGRKPKLKNVVVQLEPSGEDSFRVRIEDTGTGIEDFSVAMRLGDRSGGHSSRNEHGFGMKHALASANSGNDGWWVASRTDADLKSGQYRRLDAPYGFEMKLRTVDDAAEAWPGDFNSTGTVIEFSCSSTFYNTLQEGIKGKAGQIKCLEYLVEDLGYTYAGVIEKGKVSITVRSDGLGFDESVGAIKPSWKGPYPPGLNESVQLDLGGGTVTVEYSFGEMKESSHARYYKRNMETSGVEIRLNGRVMMRNLFKRIWGIENHPSYNHLLVLVNVVSDDLSKLPRTRTSKNGIRSDDPKLEKLLEWIHSVHPKPEKKSSGAVSERELVRELKTLKEKHLPKGPTKVESDFEVFNTLSSPVMADMYVFDGQDITLYEAKKDNADIQNLYQLLMYWDGAVEDGHTPARGVLLASSFSPGVDVLMKAINARTDKDGNQYVLEKRTWKDEGIAYPK